MEDDLTTKQNLVNTEIINKGINIESFNQYLCSLKGDNGNNLTLWTLYDLEQAILQFHKQSSSSGIGVNAEQAEYLSSATMTNIINIKEEIQCLGPEESDFSSDANIRVQLSL